MAWPAVGQAGARVTVTSTGTAAVTPDAYRFWGNLTCEGVSAAEIERETTALLERLRKVLSKSDIEPSEVNVYLDVRYPERRFAPGEGPAANEIVATAQWRIDLDVNSVGGIDDRVPRLTEIREQLAVELDAYVAETPADDEVTLEGPSPVLRDETAYRQAAIGAAVKASLSDGEAAAAALNAALVSSETVEIRSAGLSWDGTGLSVRGEYKASAKVTYIVGAKR